MKMNQIEVYVSESGEIVLKQDGGYDFKNDEWNPDPIIKLTPEQVELVAREMMVLSREIIP